MGSRSIPPRQSYLRENTYLLSINAPAPIQYSMGAGVYNSYDNIRLLPGGASSWRHMPNNVPLRTDKIVVFQGSSLPLREETRYSDIPADSMFIFANNRADIRCMDSTFSSDQGGVCTTPEQRNFIGVRRGNNKTFPGENPDF